MLQLRTLEANPVDRMPHPEALELWVEWLVANGRARHNAKRTAFLGKPGSNAKTAKNGRRTYTFSAAPSATSQLLNVCPNSTVECRNTCLWEIGRGGEPTVVAARKIRTGFLAAHPAAAASLIYWELRKAVDAGEEIAARLNALSDIAWETLAPWIFADLPEVIFYDYTKRWTRAVHPAPNYTLTFSASERTPDVVIARKVADGATVAVVLDVKHRAGAKVQAPLPETYAGCRVVDGDKTDERFAETGVIVGLRAKGKARALPTGPRHFVKHADPVRAALGDARTNQLVAAAS
jgi:hypothetical protein